MWTKEEFRASQSPFDKELPVAAYTAQRYESEKGWVGVDIVNADGNREALCSIAEAVKAGLIKWDEAKQSYVSAGTVMAGRSKGKWVNKGTNSPSVEAPKGKTKAIKA